MKEFRPWDSAGKSHWRGRSPVVRPSANRIGIVEAEEKFKLEEGYTNLFNGTDLTGWEYGETPPKQPSEFLDDRTESSDQRCEVKDGAIVASSGKGPNMAIYTADEFNKDFTLRLEFRTSAQNKKNGGAVFIRGTPLRLDAVSDGGRNGVFKNVKNFRPGDWNEIEVAVKGTAAVCKCNGEAVGRPMEVPKTGPIALHAEVGKFEFRRIRMKESP